MSTKLTISKLTNTNTNIDIITEALVETGLIDTYTVEEINSFQQWKQKGYKVNKGEKATLKLYIWYPSKYKKDDKEEYLKFYLKLTALFTKDQVSPIK